MKLEERDALRAEIRAKVGKWPQRLEKLAARKKDPLSERQFCLKHGITLFGFNRIKNGHNEPRQKKVDQVEAALAAEGV